jgi:hypothetical protein
MHRHHALRSSILLALGAAGCSASSSGDGTPVVNIAAARPAPSSSAPAEKEAPRRPLQRGWVTSPDHTAHRVSKTTCDTSVDQKACAGTEQNQSCHADADCKAKPHGKCTSGVSMSGTYCGCVYPCESDSECDAGQVCVCKGTGTMQAKQSVCVQADCTVDAECSEGTCNLASYNSGCSEELRVACRTSDDACHNDADCKLGRACFPEQGKAKGERARWKCADWSCAPGRPLIVEGELRAAASVRREAWGAALALDTRALDTRERAALAGHFAWLASLEHASVASFARFSLQLLALGAPAALLAEAQRAAIDEVEHAQICYGIASQLAGQALGPDVLPAATAPLASALPTIVEALVREGCVGETLGAAEAREMARASTQPALRTAFTTIADDEERHAALSWRALAWMLAAFGEPARASAERAFAQALVDRGDEVAHGAPVNEGFGLLPSSALSALRREVLAEVVRPCWVAALRG